DSASNAGAVYVFSRDSADVWSQQAYVKASNTWAGDRFGWSVALAADGDTLAVGANREDSNATGIDGDQSDNSATESGAVYLY
ncbi:MAG: FG-GAP repeat protein, partial [Thiohalophilus sp.]